MIKKAKNAKMVIKKLIKIFLIYNNTDREINRKKMYLVLVICYYTKIS